MPSKLERAAGMALFGSDVDLYDRARPDYPDELYQFVVNSVGSLAGLTVLDIGAGNGLASKALLHLDIGQLSLVEPDTRFEPILERLKSSAHIPIKLLLEPFEEIAIGPEKYDFLFAATSFHWLDPDTRLQKVASLLVPNGSVALMWNVFGDASQPDLFHDATQHLFSSVLISPSNENSDKPFALDVEARVREFKASLCFEEPEIHKICWQLEIDTAQMLALYSTFSGVNALSESARKALLNSLEAIANEHFGGLITRNMTSIVYLAKKAIKPVATKTTKAAE